MSDTSANNPDGRVSEWTKSQVACPFCGATNRPFATFVVQQPDGSSLCIGCGKSFHPTK